MAVETKKQRFERLAERRVAELIKKMRLIGNLSNRGNYEYSETHVRQMFGALDRELKTARDRFSINESGSDPCFSFQKNKKEV